MSTPNHNFPFLIPNSSFYFLFYFLQQNNRQKKKKNTPNTTTLKKKGYVYQQYKLQIGENTTVRDKRKNAKKNTPYLALPLFIEK
jgi:hypothetical protein